MEAFTHRTSLDLRPSFGPAGGGTAITILHHRDFSSAHDVLLGTARLNCSAAHSSEGVAHSRCCCTPPSENVSSLSLAIVNRAGRTVARPTHSHFAYYREPQLLWLAPFHASIAGGTPITLAVAGWPSTETNGGRDHVGRCKLALSERSRERHQLLVPAVVVARHDSWHFHRPTNENETWLRCVTPDLRSRSLGHGGTHAHIASLMLWISANGVDFGPEALPLEIRSASSLGGSSRPSSLLPLLVGVCFAACVLAGIAHSYVALKMAMSESGWVDSTPSHWSASRWHGAMRKGHGGRGGQARWRVCASGAHFDPLMRMESDRLSRISESSEDNYRDSFGAPERSCDDWATSQSVDSTLGAEPGAGEPRESEGASPLR